MRVRPQAHFVYRGGARCRAQAEPSNDVMNPWVCLSHPHCRRMRGSCFLSPYCEPSHVTPTRSSRGSRRECLRNKETMLGGRVVSRDSGEGREPEIRTKRILPASTCLMVMRRDSPRFTSLHSCHEGARERRRKFRPAETDGGRPAFTNERRLHVRRESGQQRNTKDALSQSHMT